MEELKNIISMWQAVVMQAVLDALQRKDDKIKMEAIRWIFHQDHKEDFEAVCDMAQFCPNWIRDNLKKKNIKRIYICQ